MIHVTYRLTAKNRDQFRNPTLGRVSATFYLFNIRPTRIVKSKKQQQNIQPVVPAAAQQPGALN